MTVTLLLLELLGWLFGTAPELAGGLGGVAGVGVLAVMAAGTVLVALTLARRGFTPPSAGPLSTSSVRWRGERTAFLPLRDPDAAGRPRPRAPSACPRAA